MSVIKSENTDKRLAVWFLERVEDDFFDLSVDLADDDGLPSADCDSVVSDCDFDIPGLWKLSTVLP